MSRSHKDQSDILFDCNLNFQTRTIFVGSQTVSIEHGPSGTDEAMAEHVIKGLHLLENDGPRKRQPILLKMLNLGGDWYSGMAIYDAIAASPCRTTMQVFGAAMSMGAVVLQAADRRILNPNVSFMIHKTSESHNDVDPETLLAWGKDSVRLLQKMYRIFESRSGRPASYWAKKCRHDYIMTAPEAVAEGLADGLVRSKKKR